MNTFPKPTLREGTRAKRIFNFLSTVQQASFSEIYNNQREYHANLNQDPHCLDQNVSMILGRMVYYNQIKKVSRGVYRLYHPVHFHINFLTK